MKFLQFVNSVVTAIVLVMFLNYTMAYLLPSAQVTPTSASEECKSLSGSSTTNYNIPPYAAPSALVSPEGGSVYASVTPLDSPIAQNTTPVAPAITRLQAIAGILDSRALGASSSLYGSNTAYSDCLTNHAQKEANDKVHSFQWALVRAFVIFFILIGAAVTLFRRFPFFAASLLWGGLVFVLSYPWFSTLGDLVSSFVKIDPDVKRQLELTEFLLSTIAFIGLTLADLFYFEKDGAGGFTLPFLHSRNTANPMDRSPAPSVMNFTQEIPPPPMPMAPPPPAAVSPELPPMPSFHQPEPLPHHHIPPPVDHTPPTDQPEHY